MTISSRAPTKDVASTPTSQSGRASADPERTATVPSPGEAALDAAGDRPSDSISDWEWAWGARASGSLNEYAGQHVAVYRKSVVAADPDADQAIQFALERTGAPARDLAVIYVDEPGSEGWLYVR